MKHILATAAAALISLSVAHAQTDNQTATDQADNAVPTQATFIQQAASMAFDGKTLTLKDPHAQTIVMTEQPQHMLAVVGNQTIVDLFGEIAPEDTADAPNAMVVIAGVDTEPAVVELSAANLQGSDITYKARVLEGTLPDSADNVTLFIDPWIHVGPYRPWRYGPVVVRGPVVFGPRCHYSPYYYGRVCRW